MSRIATAAKALLSNPLVFSSLVLRFPLYDYQCHPLPYILESILHQSGREFLLVFPRQSGKNEAVAQLLVYLLNLLQRKGGNIVYGAIGDGLGRGIHRLEQRLDNTWNNGKWITQQKPTRRSLNKATVVFLSTHPQAAARGETAHWLMVIDEFQDQQLAHIEAVFEPMRAANNASALYIGTVKSTNDALWQKKKELERAEQEDGYKRVFIVHPDQVIQDNPHYGQFLQSKIDKFGRNHPIIASEYFNEPIDGAGGLFGGRRLQLMIGSHSRQTAPDNQDLYVATLDVGGQDEGATDPVAQLDNPGRDYTVCTIFRMIDEPDDRVAFEAVDVFVDHGSRHFQDIPGKARLATRLLAWLTHWKVIHIVADSSGVGAGLADWLGSKLGPDSVTQYQFSPKNKAYLGTKFLALIETGRFKYWREESEYDDSWWFKLQAESCSYFVPPEGQFENHLQWSVPAQAKVSTPEGNKPIHDDRLISAALVAIYDELISADKVRTGKAKSKIIGPVDPLEGLKW